MGWNKKEVKSLHTKNMPNKGCDYIAIDKAQ